MGDEGVGVIRTLVHDDGEGVGGSGDFVFGGYDYAHDVRSLDESHVADYFNMRAIPGWGRVYVDCVCSEVNVDDVAGVSHVAVDQELLQVDVV